jgi:hypothetical protein
MERPVTLLFLTWTTKLARLNRAGLPLAQTSSLALYASGASQRPQTVVVIVAISSGRRLAMVSDLAYSPVAYAILLPAHFWPGHHNRCNKVTTILSSSIGTNRPRRPVTTLFLSQRDGTPVSTTRYQQHFAPDARMEPDQQVVDEQELHHRPTEP